MNARYSFYCLISVLQLSCSFGAYAEPFYLIFYILHLTLYILQKIFDICINSQPLFMPFYHALMLLRLFVIADSD
mgnify:CR=1 FL=1